MSGCSSRGGAGVGDGGLLLLLALALRAVGGWAFRPLVASLLGRKEGHLPGAGACTKK